MKSWTVFPFDDYIYNITIMKSIGKLRRTEESLNARFSNDVKYDSNIETNIATR